MYFMFWIFILSAIVYTEAWPCSLCKQYKEDDECSSEQKKPMWSSLGSTQQSGQLPSAVMIIPVAEPKGMHNEIITKVHVPVLREGGIKRFNGLLVQTVPSSFYVDQYELKRLPLSPVNPVFKRNIDVELPAYLSSEETILYYFNSTVMEGHRTEFTVPWHSRYHECSHEDGVFHATATIPPPVLYVSCMSTLSGDDCEFELRQDSRPICHDHPDVITAPCSPQTKSLCIWTPATRGVGDVMVRIPVGHCEHGQLVAATTLLSTFLGTVALGYFSTKY